MGAWTAWLRPPEATDPEEALRARITHWILVAAAVATSTLLLIEASTTPFESYRSPALLLCFFGTFGSLVLLHRGYVRVAGMTFSLLALASVSFAAFMLGNVRSPHLATAVLVIMITGFLVGTRVAIGIGLLTSASMLAMVVARDLGFQPPEGLPGSRPYVTWAALSSILALSAIFLHVFVRAMNEAREESAEKSRRLEEEMARRAEAEASLVRAEKLEALGRLAGGIAHDFNNIITVLLAEAQLLESHAASGLPVSDEQRQHIAEIRRSSERAANLTGQLLSFARQRVGTPSALEPNAAIERLEPMLVRLIREDIRLEVGPLAAAGVVRMDAGQFERVVMNLVLNARDAMPGGGHLRIETQNVEIDGRWTDRHPSASPGPHVLIEVSDTGTGIALADLDRIFDPFFTTKDQGRGTGLGLASVHGIVTQAGGLIRVDSEVGKGTRIGVALPVSAEVAAPAAATGPARAPVGRKTVLVCEDDAAVRQLVVRVLRASDYEVLEADAPERALARAREHLDRIDLVLSDVVMPGMSGPELVAAIRRLRPDVAVLLVSGYLPDGSADEAGSGDHAFLEKPFSPDQLRKRLSELLA